MVRVTGEVRPVFLAPNLGPPCEDSPALGFGATMREVCRASSIAPPLRRQNCGRRPGH